MQSGNEGFFHRQLFWVCVSIPVYIIFSHVDSRLWKVIAEPFFIISLLLLVLVLIYGTKISGAKRWLDLRFFNFQPSEVAKLALIIILGKLLSSPKCDVNKFSTLLMAGGFVLLPFVLIFMEPDLGSA